MRTRSVAIAGLTWLVLSCSSPDTSEESSAPSAEPSPTAPSASAGSASPPTTRPLPASPSGQPKELARELDRAVATLRDRRSTPEELRRAGEYHQLAVRRLATASAGFLPQVLAEVGRGTAAVIRGEVLASRSLISLTAPQKRLPPWRIVMPPPPAELRGYYAHAQRLTGVHWTYLAAIHLVETRMGRIRGTSTAGARGPMQFLPSTWEAYGAGGDINDPRDAILAAGRLLRANGAPTDMASALYRYNPSEHYVRAITQHARAMQRAPYTYRGYWHWRVLYRHVRGVYVLPEGYPRVPPVLLERG